MKLLRWLPAPCLFGIAPFLPPVWMIVAILGAIVASIWSLRACWSQSWGRSAAILGQIFLALVITEGVAMFFAPPLVAHLGATFAPAAMTIVVAATLLLVTYFVSRIVRRVFPAVDQKRLFKYTLLLALALVTLSYAQSRITDALPTLQAIVLTLLTLPLTTAYALERYTIALRRPIGRLKR